MCPNEMTQAHYYCRGSIWRSWRVSVPIHTMADHSEPSSNVWIVAAWNHLSRNEQAAMMVLYFMGAIMTALVCVWAKWHIIEWRRGQRPEPRRPITDQIIVLQGW
ncbi:uncharacterized protein PgNI_00966 [Pyricularia grisea]|uniref:Uncharacterized protein n=1 Tax=Pyricularia grisea TaxID=148305 RepID=A0A6P8BLP8_PYRGI|nr:uncharacterized protein PgNI_00966 [Pyricularia grisea]TLD17565.1 hypothetical protein PgNI_00966 [Pyricularia grisea]